MGLVCSTGGTLKTVSIRQNWVNDSLLSSLLDLLLYYKVVTEIFVFPVGILLKNLLTLHLTEFTSLW